MSACNVCAPCTCNNSRDQKKALDPLELGLQTVMSYKVSAENWTHTPNHCAISMAPLLANSEIHFHYSALQESVIQYIAGGKSKCRIRSTGFPECVSPSHHCKAEEPSESSRIVSLVLGPIKTPKGEKRKQINIWQCASSQLRVEEIYRTNNEQRKIQQFSLSEGDSLGSSLVLVTHCHIRVILTRKFVNLQSHSWRKRKMKTKKLSWMC